MGTLNSRTKVAGVSVSGVARTRASDSAHERPFGSLATWYAVG